MNTAAQLHRLFLRGSLVKKICRYDTIRLVNNTAAACLATFALMSGVYAQGRGDTLWAPKYPPTKYVLPHKPITRIADLLAKHKGQTTWREEIVKDDHIWAD